MTLIVNRVAIIVNIVRNLKLCVYSVKNLSEIIIMVYIPTNKEVTPRQWYNYCDFIIIL